RRSNGRERRSSVARRKLSSIRFVAVFRNKVFREAVAGAAPRVPIVRARLVRGSGAANRHQKVVPPMAGRRPQCRERRGASVVEDALRVQRGEMFLLRRLLFLGQDGRAEIVLGGGDTAAQLNID